MLEGHVRMFICEAYEYHSKYKRWSRVCDLCLPEDVVLAHVERMISKGYRMNVKPKWPDEFWCDDEK